MEAERKHAYAVRLQCWWRGILAVKVKVRRRLAIEGTMIRVEGAEGNAAIVIQVIGASFYFELEGK